jgi:hypothetical protein
MKIRKSIPQSLPSNVVVLSPKKREELQLKRAMRELDNRYLPAITGVVSVMLRGVSADIRFKTAYKLPRLWWMNHPDRPEIPGQRQSDNARQRHG